MLKEGKRVYFNENANYIFPLGLFFTGIVKKVTTSDNGKTWVHITNIECIDKVHFPKKTEKRKSIKSVFTNLPDCICSMFR